MPPFCILARHVVVTQIITLIVTNIELTLQTVLNQFYTQIQYNT